MDWLTLGVNLVAGPAVAGAVANFVVTHRVERLRANWNKELQESQNQFSLGVSSHQAQVAFDKWATFCELYMEETLRILNTRNTAGWFVAFDTAKLVRIRQRWAIWLPERLYDQLRVFEEGLANAGARTEETQEPLPIGAHVRELVEYLRQLLGTEHLSGTWIEQTRPIPRS